MILASKIVILSHSKKVFWNGVLPCRVRWKMGDYNQLFISYIKLTIQQCSDPCFTVPLYLQSSHKMNKSSFLTPKSKYLALNLQIGYPVLCEMYLFVFIFYSIDIQNNRQTHYTKEMYETSQFIYIQQELSELRYDFQKLTGYQNDKIKFMTKVEVDETAREGVRSYVKIAKEPIFAKDDVITFLLIFKWYPNTIKSSNKVRKGSFATEKEFSSLRARYNKNNVQPQELLYMVFLLSQKIYIQDRFIDPFVNIVSSKGQIYHKQLNCLTILIIGGQGKQRMGNLASTMAETNKYQHYQFENISIYASLAEPQKFISNPNNEHLLNRFTTLMHRNSSSSRLYDRSARLSVGSRQNLDDSYSKSEQRFNLQKAKKYFSAVEYLTATTQVTIQMIILHLGEDRNPIQGGLRSDVVQEVITQWPKYNTYGRIYKLNKQRIMQNLLHQAIENYRLMISMQLSEVENVNPDEIFIIIKNFNDKVTQEFIMAAKDFTSQSDYDSYLKQLEKELLKLQKQLINNYAMTKEEYGSRVVKNLERQNSKNSAQSYLLMKIIGKEQLSSLDIAYKTYKQLIDAKLQQGFSQFLANKFKSRFYRQHSGNYYEDELNNIENRIEICQAKKKNLDSAIQLGQKDSEQLQVMLKLLQHAEQVDSAKSQLLQ